MYGMMHSEKFELRWKPAIRPTPEIEAATMCSMTQARKTVGVPG